MIYSLLIILFVFLLVSSGIAIIKSQDSDLMFHLAMSLTIISFALFIIIIFSTGVVISNLNKANHLKSQIILMKPLDKFREDIAINEKELAKVERLIEKAFDKNIPNVSVKIENGVKIYSLLGSIDLGSAEAGNAEKQKLLLKYIEKQNEIADRLIYIKKLAYGDEYYQLQQKYAVYANDIFSGWLVRWFSIDEDYQPISNQIYAPNE